MSDDELLAPIVLFVYNRLMHTQRTIEALQKNNYANESRLFIYSDGPKNNDVEMEVSAVRKYIKTVSGFKMVTIIERDCNWGLANSIIDGVTKIVNEYGSIIVLEDDLVTSPYFLNFMNDGLQLYKEDDQVASIHGFLYPIQKNVPHSFFIKGTDCWGWATWERSWKIFERDGEKLLRELNLAGRQREADFNNTYDYTKMLKNQIKGKVDSWAVRWYMSAFLKDMLTLYPGVSFIANIGMDNSGVHNGFSKNFEVNTAKSYQKLEKILISEDGEVRKYFESYFKYLNRNIIPKMLYKIKCYLLARRMKVNN